MPPTEAEQITRASKSNLALAFFALPAERRRDISTFYAYCRVIDDIADDPGRSLAERQGALDHWKEALVAPVEAPPPLAASVRELIGKYQLPVGHFLEIIAGCEMDLKETVYETWDDLQRYCHRVASVVGLVSIEIFGYRDPGCRQYALDLGLALQLTNILRDVGQDYVNEKRIYLPRQEMSRFGYSAEELAKGVRNDNFLALMNFQAERAIALYQKARAALPAPDQRSMVAAEIMRTIYRSILDRMQGDGFRVFTRRYRLNKFQKSLCIARVLLTPVRL
ncbi:MAG: squalene/phytoene synthase family protein [Verrucomicrobiota bacterium]